MQNTGMKYKAALLGGSFNPIHIGHLSLIHDASAFLSIEKIILIPALLSNFKRGSRPLCFEERLHLIDLAIMDFHDIYSDNIDIEVSTVERDRGGVSYTSDTVRYYFDEYNEDGKVNFIIGDDLLENLELWHDFDYLKDHVRFFCFNRGGKRRDVDGVEIHFFDNEKVESSSTDIRSGDFSALSGRVREYVRNNGLYRA